MSERWAAIPDWPEYEVSDLGRVRRVLPARGAVVGSVLKAKLSRNGYLRVRLSRDYHRAPMHLHRLIAVAFVPRPDGAGGLVCHGDGDRTNNRVGNLYWGTHAENAQDMIDHGRSPKGTANSGAKLSEAEVLAIREAARSKTQRSIAARFGLHRNTIGLIVSGRTWGHLT